MKNKAPKTQKKTAKSADTGANQGCWLLTADRRRARLLYASKTPHDRLHVDERAAVDEEWVELQHDRPSRRTGKETRAYASVGQEEEERIRRFAKSVAGWLEREVGKHGVDSIQAFVAPRFLGQLRSALPAALGRQLTVHALNLEHLKPSELAEHDAVVSASSSHHRNRPLTQDEMLAARARDRETCAQLALEHAALDHAVRDLRAEIDRLRSEEGPGHSTGKLSGMLLMFEHHLRRHFELEESGGYLVEVGAGKGPEQRQADDLLAQHGELRHSLAGLRDAVERAEETETRLSDTFVQGLRDFLGLLVEHENSENELVEKRAARVSPALD